MKSTAHFALWIKSTNYLSFISQTENEEAQLWNVWWKMRNCSLWNAAQFKHLSVLSPISSLLSQRCVCVRVCASMHVCVCYGASWPRKADRRCATHLSNFPKTVGLLPVHSLTLNQPQSATYLLKCLEPRLRVCVWLFICLFVSLCDCLQKPFSPQIQLPIVFSWSNSETFWSSLFTVIFKSLSLCFFFWALKDQF